MLGDDRKTNHAEIEGWIKEQEAYLEQRHRKFISSYGKQGKSVTGAAVIELLLGATKTLNRELKEFNFLDVVKLAFENLPPGFHAQISKEGAKKFASFAEAYDDLMNSHKRFKNSIPKSLLQDDKMHAVNIGHFDGMRATWQRRESKSSPKPGRS